MFKVFFRDEMLHHQNYFSRLGSRLGSFAGGGAVDGALIILHYSLSCQSWLIRDVELNMVHIPIQYMRLTWDLRLSDSSVSHRNPYTLGLLLQRRGRGEDMFCKSSVLRSISFRSSRKLGPTTTVDWFMCWELSIKKLINWWNIYYVVATPSSIRIVIWF